MGGSIGEESSLNPITMQAKNEAFWETIELKRL